MSTLVRIEKCKWDGRVSAVDHGHLVSVDRPVLTWFVPYGSERRRPARGTTERLEHDELWITAPDEWWVLCAASDGGSAVADLVLHAAVPLEQTTPGTITWIDLDLDFEMHENRVSLEDEDEFHRHAAAMAYPKEVIRGAWFGISRLAPRYTTREWPFNGWLERCLATAQQEVAVGAGRRHARAGDAPTTTYGVGRASLVAGPAERLSPRGPWPSAARTLRP